MRPLSLIFLRGRTALSVFALMFVCAMASAAAASLPAAPVVRFLSIQEARSALTEPEVQRYFDSLYLGEMRAKTGLPLTGLTLAEARERTRKHYASEVLEFSPDERAALAGVVARLYPVLAQKAPLYARTAWSFMKVSTKVEGGLPHTHGAHIILSPAILQEFVEHHKQGRFSQLDAIAAYLLAHEQTHVIQRLQPALFATLCTDVFGFRHIDPAPVTPWLLERSVVNPDAPDSGWAYPLVEGNTTRWIMPYLLLRNRDTPRMPQDFVLAAVTLEHADDRWSVAQRNGQPVVEPLLGIEAYIKAFPDPSQAYHPNEIAADVLGSWIIGQSMDHPMVEKSAKWAERHLK